MLQGTFSGMQESVIICMGGGHEHGPDEVVDRCELECTHHDDWATTPTSDQHKDDCGCTDIEVALITLLSTSRCADNVFYIAPPTVIATLNYHTVHTNRANFNPTMKEDPGGKHRITLIRTTRLIV